MEGRGSKKSGDLPTWTTVTPDYFPLEPTKSYKCYRTREQFLAFQVVT